MKFDKLLKSKIQTDEDHLKSKRVNDKSVKFEEEVTIGDAVRQIIPIELINQTNKQHLGLVNSDNSDDNTSEMIVRKLPNNKVEVYSPNMKQKITLRNIKSKIQSTLHKRIELDHIDQTINAMNKVPDFGYENSKMDYSNECGFNLLTSILSNNMKYERLENYI